MSQNTRSGGSKVKEMESEAAIFVCEVEHSNRCRCDLKRMASEQELADQLRKKLKFQINARSLPKLSESDKEKSLR